MVLCKNCRWWARRGKGVGHCEGIDVTSYPSPEPGSAEVFQDIHQIFEEPTAGLITHEEFGCVLGEGKEEPAP